MSPVDVALASIIVLIVILLFGLLLNLAIEILALLLKIIFYPFIALYKAIT